MPNSTVKPTIHIGCGAGFSGDRTDAAAPVVRTLVARGGASALIFETLAERTLATAQLARRANPEAGFEPLLDLALRPILADCLRHGITIVGNFGAANPLGAARRIVGLAAELGLPRPRVAVVSGDDLSAAEHRPLLRRHLHDSLPEGGRGRHATATAADGGRGKHATATAADGGRGRGASGPAAGSGASADAADDFDEARFVCANVYQGAFEIAAAIQASAQIVVTGRVADPSLTLGPAIAHFGWQRDDWNALAGATMAGHLLECGAQVTGGYFADPGKKDVPGLDDVGFPIAEIAADGSCNISKAEDTGGLVDERTVKEQLLYEIHDPAAYFTPDVVADFSQATVTQVGADRVRLAGVIGHPRTATLKANVFFDGGWFGEGEISYAGPNAEARARAAMAVMGKRCGSDMALRFDLIGLTSILGDDAGRLLDSTGAGGLQSPGLQDIRLRVAGKHQDAATIERLLRELTALWTGGPAGGGGVRVTKRQRLAMRSCLLPREAVPARFNFID